MKGENSNVLGEDGTLSVLESAVIIICFTPNEAAN
jgi:hypothetical protein